MAATTTNNRPQYASTSLYVGDLSPEVSEATLYEFFNSVGPVASIKVCRDSSSRRSLRYAYVNYHSIADAERALESLNYTPIKGNPCRIMWSQRDPAVRKSNQGNLFVKNLDKGVDNRALHDTFSLFGNILSCKVVSDDQGRSKGYGFVHFETDEAAASAVERVNGMKIGSKEVYVAPHQKRVDRPSGKTEFYTNLYVKDFPKTWSEEIVRQIFSPFGEITSIWLSTDNKGRPFSCVNFNEPACAKQALATLNGKKVNQDGLLSAEEEETLTKREELTAASQPADPNKQTDTAATDDDKTAAQTTSPPQDSERLYYVLYVDRAQDKSERHMALRNRYERNNQSGSGPRNKYEGVNLYIKNLSDNVDDDGLRTMFEQYGAITSAKVMRDEDQHSKGFGFVCFTTAEEATKAIAEMHLKLLDGKPLYVGLAEQKERRHARLQNHFRGNGPRGGNMMQQQQQQQQPQPNQFPGAPNPFGGPSAGGSTAPFYGGPQTPGPLLGNHTWHTNPQFPQPPHPGPAHAPNVMWKATSAGYAAAVAAAPPPPYATGPHGGRPPVSSVPQQASRPTEGASSTMNKQFLGEQLFPLIYIHQPTLAGKITGMMLDMDENELQLLLHSEHELKAKINEALLVLEKAQQP